VGRITLNRPEKMNTLSQELLFELWEALHDYEADDSCRVIIVKARTTFSAGYDLTPARAALTVSSGATRPLTKAAAAADGHPHGMQQITDIHMYFWNMAR